MPPERCAPAAGFIYLSIAYALRFLRSSKPPRPSKAIVAGSGTGPMISPLCTPPLMTLPITIPGARLLSIYNTKELLPGAIYESGML